MEGGECGRRSRLRLSQVVAQLGHGLIALPWRLREAALHDGLQRGRRIQRRGLVAQNRRHGGDGVLAMERPPPAEQLVQHRAETEDVRPRIERLALGLLRSHVRRRAHHRADRRAVDRRGIVGAGRLLGQSEIEQLDRSFRGHHDVGGFQIAMHDAFAMRGIQRFRDLHRQPHGVVDVHAALERLPFDVFEHQVIRPDVEDLADVRMIQRGNRARFLLKARAVLALEPLHCDRAIETTCPAPSTLRPYRPRPVSRGSRRGQVCRPRKAP